MAQGHKRVTYSHVAGRRFHSATQHSIVNALRIRRKMADKVSLHYSPSTYLTTSGIQREAIKKLHTEKNITKQKPKRNYNKIISQISRRRLYKALKT